MPLYTYLCPNCREFMEEFVTMSQHKDEVKCTNCGGMAPQTLMGSIVTHKDSPRVSQAMGVHPSQIEAAAKKWPGSKYLADGSLLIANRTEKKQRMKERGLVEL